MRWINSQKQYIKLQLLINVLLDRINLSDYSDFLNENRFIELKVIDQTIELPHHIY